MSNLRPIGRANTQEVLADPLDPQSRTRHAAPIPGIGGAYRDRTDDPLLAKQVLSQLS